MNKMIPNLFIIGVQKTGTTSFHNWLKSHPEIVGVSELKDKHILFKDDSEKIYNTYYNNKEGVYYLDASVNYFYYHKYFIEKAKNPEKILLFIRDPIERAISAYKYNYMNGRDNRGINEAIDYDWNDSNIIELNYYNSNFTYIEHGLYYRRIKELKYIYEDRLKVFVLEEIKNDREKFVHDLSQFLGINLVSDIPKDNASKNIKSYYVSKVINNNNYYKNFIKKIIGQKTARSIAHKIDKINKSGNIDFVINKEILIKLKEYYKEDINSTSKILDKDLMNIWEY